MTWDYARKAIGQYKFLIAMLIIVGATAGAIIAAAQPDRYRASTQLAVEMSSAADGDSQRDLAADRQYLHAQLPTYLEYAKSTQVITPVIDQLHLKQGAEQIRRQLEFTVPSDTLVIQITATWSTPSGAARLANATAASFAAHAPGFETGNSASPQVTANIYAPATSPSGPVDTLVIFTAVGGAGGAVLSIVMAWILALRDPYARNLPEVARAAGAPVIGVLTRRRVHGRLAVRGHPEVPRTFEGLYGRAQITDPTGYRPRIMTIVSTSVDSAPAAVAWHLAGIAARSGLRTEVASGDTRMHEYLLAEQYAMSCSELGPLVLPTHTLQPPAGGILSTAGLTLALNAVTSNADLILIAAASPLIDANAHSQIRIADSVIATATPKPRTQTIAAVCDRIRQSSAGLIGVAIIDAGEPHTANHGAHHRELETLGVIRT